MGASLADNDPSVCIDANTGWSGNNNGFDQRSIGLEHLNAAVRVISHQDVVIGINEEVVGTRELTSTNMTNKITLRIKDGNTMAAALSNNDISIRHKANADRVGKLTISISRRLKFPQELAI